MATNPILIPGNLNRVRASIIVPNNTTYNIPAQYLAKEGIAIAAQTAVNTQFQGMTTIVNSNEPYQLVQLTISLVKTLALAESYKELIENNPNLDQITVVPDTNVLSEFTLYNCAIMNWNGQSFAGTQADYTFMIQGAYYISNNLWSVI